MNAGETLPGRARLLPACGIALLAAALPVTAMGAPVDEPARRGDAHNVLVSAPPPASERIAGGGTISDLAAITLLLSGFYAFLYARRRNIGQQEHRSVETTARPATRRKPERRVAAGMQFAPASDRRDAGPRCRQGHAAAEAVRGTRGRGRMQPG